MAKLPNHRNLTSKPLCGSKPSGALWGLEREEVSEGGGRDGWVVLVQDDAEQGAQEWSSPPQQIWSGPLPLLMTAQEQLVSEGKQEGKQVSVSKKILSFQNRNQTSVHYLSRGYTRAVIGCAGAAIPGTDTTCTMEKPTPGPQTECWIVLFCLLTFLWLRCCGFVRLFVFTSPYLELFGCLSRTVLCIHKHLAELSNTEGLRDVLSSEEAAAICHLLMFLMNSEIFRR